MNRARVSRPFALLFVSLCISTTARAAPSPAPTSATILATSPATDWRPLDPRHTLYMELAGGRVVIELAPAFAPHHVANVETLVKERYFDGMAIVRAQDDYVVQWADPAAEPVEGESHAAPRSVGTAHATLAPEFARASAQLPFTPLPDADTYAPEVGFSDGFPAARDPAERSAWLIHCYGMVGVGRDEAADSGGGSELYAVIGHAPRQLDRNVTLIGRVLSGIELLSTLPRGTGALGFYTRPSERAPIRSIRLAVDVPASQRTELEMLRTDSATFRALINARRHRREPWFKYSAGRIDVCNMPLPVRAVHQP